MGLHGLGLHVGASTVCWPPHGLEVLPQPIQRGCVAITTAAAIDKLRLRLVRTTGLSQRSTPVSTHFERRAGNRFSSDAVRGGA